MYHISESGLFSGVFARGKTAIFPRDFDLCAITRAEKELQGQIRMRVELSPGLGEIRPARASDQTDDQVVQGAPFERDSVGELPSVENLTSRLIRP